MDSYSFPPAPVFLLPSFPRCSAYVVGFQTEVPLTPEDGLQNSASLQGLHRYRTCACSLQVLAALGTDEMRGKWRIGLQELSASEAGQLNLTVIHASAMGLTVGLPPGCAWQ